MSEKNNAVDLLQAQHQQIRRLLRRVSDATDAKSRQESFDRLRELIAVHETAEEIVVRPVTRGHVLGGEEIAAERMAEENEGKQVLAELEKMGVDDLGFAPKFAAFRADVDKHAEKEETEEFPALRRSVDTDTLDTMGKRIQQAESAAPTHPHPGAKTTAANLVLGPAAAVADRIRDALAS